VTGGEPGVADGARTPSPAAAPEALHQMLHRPAETDPDLARVVASWAELSPPIKAAIMALVRTADHGERHGG